MPTIVTRPIFVKSGDFVNDGVVHLRVFDRRERMIRATKSWGLMWLLAVPSIFIPIAHFVLVPGFLIAGLVMAIKRFRVLAVFDQVSGNCPAGREEFTLQLEATDRLPEWAYCPVCDASLHLMDKEQSLPQHNG